MALTYGPNLGLLVNGDEGEAHYLALMKQYRALDLLIQTSVKDRDLTTPPSSPVDGDAYIIPAGATGAWSGKTNNLTRWSSVEAEWEFFVPHIGWESFVVDESAKCRFGSGGWAPI